VDPRTRARQLAMQALCQLDVQGASVLAELNSFFTESEQDLAIRKLASDWAKGTWENVAECDKLIAGAAIKWKLPRLSMVDKSIIRLAVYQLKCCPDIPPKVAINEAIELAKIFGSDKSPAFVNGVLDGILKKLQPGRKTEGKL
jgi:transcription antitermination factor NusB